MPDRAGNRLSKHRTRTLFLMSGCPRRAAAPGLGKSLNQTTHGNRQNPGVRQRRTHPAFRPHGTTPRHP
eukprot:11227534-Lingulodinium_polyedra.AAC.1